mmetsp:Transcript_134934/g.305442  ORF Transcript_134934/g.305442 Transcript_134934/m.305442 type:complete len:283 (-) Transcript_134934:156-1004(-)
MYEEESIYKIIPPEAPVMEKQPMYRSKHSGKAPPSCSTFGLAQTSKPGVTNMQGETSNPRGSNHSFRKSKATFGPPPGSSVTPPTGILLKGTGAAKVEPLSAVKKKNPECLKPATLKDKIKPPVPKIDEKPIMNLVSSKNFITANAVENILAAPKKVSKDAKDYLHKADYGKVPGYLQRIKQDIEEEYTFIRQMQEEEQNASAGNNMRCLSDAERTAMIEGLKAKWEKVNTDYQSSTHITKLDTVGKVRRKEQYEATLSQIEKDIERLNRKYIFVDADGMMP